MRKKAYYTINEIENNLFTTGSEWQTADGNEYVGLYHQYTTGEVYTQPKWNPNLSVKLMPYELVSETVKKFKQLRDINVTYEAVQPYSIKLTQLDLIQGQLNRYFIKRANEQTVLEIDLVTYQKWKTGKIDPNMYTAVEIVWSITGDLKHVVDMNNIQIQYAKTVISNIDTILNDPAQYYTTTDNITSIDINGLDS